VLTLAARQLPLQTSASTRQNFPQGIIERLWRSVKYENIFLHDYANASEVIAGLKQYFRFYNHERPHQSLGKKTPASVYFAKHRAD